MVNKSEAISLFSSLNKFGLYNNKEDYSGMQTNIISMLESIKSIISCESLSYLSYNNEELVYQYNISKYKETVIGKKNTQRKRVVI